MSFLSKCEHSNYSILSSPPFPLALKLSTECVYFFYSHYKLGAGQGSVSSEMLVLWEPLAESPPLEREIAKGFLPEPGAANLKLHFTTVAVTSIVSVNILSSRILLFPSPLQPLPFCVCLF